MKKALIILTLLLTGCTQLKEVEQDYNQDDIRFGTQYIKDGLLGGVILICDSELNVEYMFINNGYGAGLTVRYNALGQPKECDY